MANELSITPPLTDEAQAEGRERHGEIIETLGRRWLKGQSFLR